MESLFSMLRSEYILGESPPGILLFCLRDDRHSRFNPCSVNVCTGTHVDNNCTKYEAGVPGENGTRRPKEYVAAPFALRARMLRPRQQPGRWDHPFEGRARSRRNLLNSAV